MNPNPITPMFFTVLALVTELVLGFPSRCLLLLSALDPPYGPVAAGSRHPPCPPSTVACFVALLSGLLSSAPPPPPLLPVPSGGTRLGAPCYPKDERR
jgi:hypothetical protein